jgi:hypothetical protein
MVTISTVLTVYAYLTLKASAAWISSAARSARVRTISRAIPPLAAATAFLSACGGGAGAHVYSGDAVVAQVRSHATATRGPLSNDPFASQAVNTVMFRLAGGGAGVVYVFPTLADAAAVATQAPQTMQSLGVADAASERRGNVVIVWITKTHDRALLSEIAH